jgi:hypothetical protein
MLPEKNTLSVMQHAGRRVNLPLTHATNRVNVKRGKKKKKIAVTFNDWKFTSSAATPL